MNADTLKGQWKQLMGAVKAQWGRLTDDDLTTIDGDLDRLLGRIQELYGEARETVHAKLAEIAERIRAALADPRHGETVETPTA